METDQINAKLAYWPTEMQLEKELWLVDQLTVLAEAFGESGEKMSPQRLEIYAGDLADLNRDQLKLALTRARRECRFFPKIAELREFAGADAEGIRNVEAQAAWGWVNEYLQKWGVYRMSVYQGGRRIEAPPIPARVDYALRRVGGLQALNQVTFDSRPFMQKSFIEAYNQAPLAELLAPQLAETFGATKLLGSARQLTGGHPRDKEHTVPARKAENRPFKPKTIPTPLTDSQLRDRRQMLQQQVAMLSNPVGSKGGQ